MRKYLLILGPVCLIVIAGLIAYNKNNEPLTRESNSYEFRNLSTESLTPGREIDFRFQIIDQKTGEPVRDFAIVHEKPLHMFTVNSDLTGFQHIHPELVGDTFAINLDFPVPDVYQIFLDFQPTNDNGQSLRVPLEIPSGAKPSQREISPDKNLTKIIDGLELTLASSDGKPINAGDLSVSLQLLNFHITDARTKQPITDLEPYLGAFGHLVLINAETYEYIHVHPLLFEQDQRGPNVQFMVMPLPDSSVSPGVYRAFAQFQRAGQIITADFTIEIQ